MEFQARRGPLQPVAQTFHSAVKDVDAASFASRHPWRDGRQNAEPEASWPATLWRLEVKQARAPSHHVCRPCLGHLSPCEHFPFAHGCFLGRHDILTSALSCYSPPLAHLDKMSETKHCFTKLLQKPIPVGCCLLFWKARTTCVLSEVGGRGRSCSMAAQMEKTPSSHLFCFTLICLIL